MLLEFTDIRKKTNEQRKHKERHRYESVSVESVNRVHRFCSGERNPAECDSRFGIPEGPFDKFDPMDSQR